METDKKLHFLPGRVVPRFKETQFVKHLPSETRDLVTKLAGDQGYRSAGLMTAFPYMAPDNNCGAWIDSRLAGHFTLNGRGVKMERAAKKYSPPAPSSMQDKLRYSATKLSAEASEVLAHGTGDSHPEVSKVIDIQREFEGVHHLMARFGFEFDPQTGELLERLRVCALIELRGGLDRVGRMTEDGASTQLSDLLLAGRTLVNCHDNLLRLRHLPEARQLYSEQLPQTFAAFKKRASDVIEKVGADVVSALGTDGELQLTRVWEMRSALEGCSTLAQLARLPMDVRENLRDLMPRLAARSRDAIALEVESVAAAWNGRPTDPSEEFVQDLFERAARLRSQPEPFALTVAQAESMRSPFAGISSLIEYRKIIREIEDAITPDCLVPLSCVEGHQRRICALSDLGQKLGRDATEDMARLSTRLLNAAERQLRSGSIESHYWAMDYLKASRGRCLDVLPSIASRYDELVLLSMNLGYETALQELAGTFAYPKMLGSEYSYKNILRIHELRRIAVQIPRDSREDMDRLLTGMSAAVGRSVKPHDTSDIAFNAAALEQVREAERLATDFELPGHHFQEVIRELEARLKLNGPHQGSMSATNESANPDNAILPIAAKAEGAAKGQSAAPANVYTSYPAYSDDLTEAIGCVIMKHK